MRLSHCVVLVALLSAVTGTVRAAPFEVRSVPFHMVRPEGLDDHVRSSAINGNEVAPNDFDGLNNIKKLYLFPRQQPDFKPDDLSFDFDKKVKVQIGLAKEVERLSNADFLGYELKHGGMSVSDLQSVFCSRAQDRFTQDTLAFLPEPYVTELASLPGSSDSTFYPMIISGHINLTSHCSWLSGERLHLATVSTTAEPRYIVYRKVSGDFAIFASYPHLFVTVRSDY